LLRRVDTPRQRPVALAATAFFLGKMNMIALGQASWRWVAYVEAVLERDVVHVVEP